MSQHYCYMCGSPLCYSQPTGDDRIREMCTSCGWINYDNPKVQVGVVAVNRGRILWLKRAIEPRAGYWDLPGGFMEIDESPREAAAREAREETGVELDPDTLDLFVVANVRVVNQVHIFFRAECQSEQIQLGPEALEARWLDEDEVPWDQLAFPVIEQGLRYSYEAVRQGKYGIFYVENEDEGVNVARYI